ncbi:hypothetical protein GCM10027021_20480 [Dyella kyungheensis]
MRASDTRSFGVNGRANTGMTKQAASSIASLAVRALLQVLSNARYGLGGPGCNRSSVSREKENARDIGDPAGRAVTLAVF